MDFSEFIGALSFTLLIFTIGFVYGQRWEQINKKEGCTHDH